MTKTDHTTNLQEPLRIRDGIPAPTVPFMLELSDATLAKLDTLLRDIVRDTLAQLLSAQEVMQVQQKPVLPPMKQEVEALPIKQPEPQEEQPKEPPIMRRRGGITEVVRGGVWTRVE